MLFAFPAYSLCVSLSADWRALSSLFMLESEALYLASPSIASLVDMVLTANAYTSLGEKNIGT